MTQTSDAVAGEDFDLVIVGAGSGNSLIGPEMDDWNIAIIERSEFGGTCMNRGCIPSKMLIYAADVAETVTTAGRYGVHATLDGADWPGIVERVFGRIDPIVAGGRAYRLSNHNVTVFAGDARFVGPRELEVNGQRVRGTQVVIATGARTWIPDIPGLDTVDFETSDTIMRIAAQPKHLIVMGGGFIAAELGHVFQALGSRVTIVNRSHRLLVAEDHDVSARYTEVARERFDLVLGAEVERVERSAGGVTVHVRTDTGRRQIEGDVLLVATGRVPNGDQLDVKAAGVELDSMGRVVVDQHGLTTAPGVWALGDVVGRHQLKHMANGEARVVRHNLSHPDSLEMLDNRPAPHAVFTSPQIGAVGPTEQQVRAAGRDVCVITQPYGAAAYGWALEDTTGFVKLIGDPATRTLIAAHVMGYQGSMLVQPLVQGIHLGTTVDDLATGQIWIHPALSEVVEQALLTLIDAFDAHAGAAG